MCSVCMYQDQVDVCKHVIYYCVQMKKDIDRMAAAQRAAKWVCGWITANNSNNNNNNNNNCYNL